MDAAGKMARSATQARRMSFNCSRRSFLNRDLFRGLANILNGSWTHVEEESERPRDYFSSFESCQPLLSEAGELLYEEAARLGIETEGRTREDIAREIFSRPQTRKR